MRNSAKLAVLVAVGASAAFMGCSSSDDSSTAFGGSSNTGGSAGSHAGTSSTGGMIGASGSLGVSGGGTTGVAGASAGSGGAAAGSGGASAGTGGAAAGTGGAAAGSGGAAAGTGGAAAGSGGGGGTGGTSNAVVATCGTQTYTPTATPGAGCVTTVVPTASLVSAFEGAGVAPGWGVYPNVDGMTGFVPTTATPSAGGANGTAQALSFVVTALAQGIKIQVGFGTQCQDVRTFQGLSFWAKGTIDAATLPFPVDANTLVLLVGSENAGTVDRRVTISADWKEYRIPFDCFGNGLVFDGYYTNILFNAFGTNSNFAIDEVGYYH